MRVLGLIFLLHNKRNLFLTGLLLFAFGKGFSQVDESNHYVWKSSVGIQFNPTVDEFNDIYYPVDSRKMFAYAIRYGYNVHPNIKIGPEISGYKREHFSSVRTYMCSVTKIGVFGRASLNRLKYVLPFFEASGYFYHCNSITNLGYYEESRFNALRGYIAPGISVSLFKNRINVDLMYKVGDEFVNRKKSMVSYRIGYNFNIKNKRKEASGKEDLSKFG